MDKNRIEEPDQTVRGELEQVGPNSPDPFAKARRELREIDKLRAEVRSLRRQRLVVMIALCFGGYVTWTTATRYEAAVDARELVINRCMLHVTEPFRPALRARLLEPFPSSQDTFVPPSTARAQ